MPIDSKRYQIQIQSIINGKWYDISSDVWSQPCTKQGYGQLVNDVKSLVESEKCNYRIVKRVTTDEVFYTEKYHEKLV